MSSYHIPTQPQTYAKYRAIQERYRELSDKKIDVNGYQASMRHDDKVKILMREFYIMSEFTIWRILNTELDAACEKDWAEQLSLFD